MTVLQGSSGDFQTLCCLQNQGVLESQLLALGGSDICRWGTEEFSLGLWLQDGVSVTLGLLQENLGCHQQEQLWFWLIGCGFGCSGACPCSSL